MRWRKKTLNERASKAKEQLAAAKTEAARIQRDIIEPAKKIRKEDDFAQIVRESLLIGHPK